jgi:anti-anti-sigma regulatory factor
VVRPGAGLDEDGCARLAGILSDLIAGQPDLAVAVDLTRVDRFDLAAVEKFESAAAAAAQGGGTLLLRCPSVEVVAVLATGGLARLISNTGPQNAVRSPTERATGWCGHPAGSALRDPDPAATERPGRVPNLEDSMSGQSSRVPDQDNDDPELVAITGGSWSALDIGATTEVGCPFESGCRTVPNR